jgi:hypothetical protein
VAAVPGIPLSVYYCGECLQLGRTHPYWTLVVNTALIGGNMEHAADWWKETVDTQLPLLDKTREQFDKDVMEELQGLPPGMK